LRDKAAVHWKKLIEGKLSSPTKGSRIYLLDLYTRFSTDYRYAVYYFSMKLELFILKEK